MSVYFFYPKTRKELIHHACIPSGKDKQLHRYVEPPPAQPRFNPKGKGTSFSYALTSRKLGLHLKGAILYLPGKC